MANTQITTSKLSPAQRMMNFLIATRQYRHTLQYMSFSEGNSVRMDLPKNRFAAKMYLNVSGTYKATHASKTTMTLNTLAQYRLIDQLRIEINNGFNPYQLGGVELALYNATAKFSPAGTDPYGTNTFEHACSSSGTVNDVNFTMEVPFTISDKDLIGLLNLQHSDTVVNVTVNCGKFANVMSDTDITISDINLKITPTLETFSIPLNPDQVPDYSVIKLVNQEIFNVASAGSMILRVPTGLTYRKAILYIASDTKYTALDPANISSMQIVFNQADTPYNVDINNIKYLNNKDYGGNLPVGAYAFDFSTQGIANMGGSRDYIDTERLTEFWIKIEFANLTGSTNYVHLITEKLARAI